MGSGTFTSCIEQDTSALRTKNPSDTHAPNATACPKMSSAVTYVYVVNAKRPFSAQSRGGT